MQNNRKRLGKSQIAIIHPQNTSDTPGTVPTAPEHHFRFAAATLENGQNRLEQPCIVRIHRENTFLTLATRREDNSCIVIRLLIRVEKNYVQSTKKSRYFRFWKKFWIGCGNPSPPPSSGRRCCPPIFRLFLLYDAPFPRYWGFLGENPFPMYFKW